MPLARVPAACALVLMVSLRGSCTCGDPGQAPTITAVSVAATPAALAPEGSSTLRATVSGTGDFDAGVAWSLVSGGGTLSATAGASVTYHAAGVAAGTQVVVKATSQADGTKSGTATLSVTALPVITAFTATPSNLPAGGGQVTLAWAVTGADHLAIDQGVGAVTGTQQTTTVSSATTFTLTATNAVGSATATATVTLSPAGSTVWLRQTGTTASDSATGAAVDASGNLFVAGTTGGAFADAGAGGVDAFLIRYDAAGNELWRVQEGGTANDKGYAVAAGPGGGAYLAGMIVDTGGPGSFEGFVTRYDAAGTRLWRRMFGIPGSGLNGLDEAFGVASDATGNVVAVGHTVGSFAGVNDGGHDAFAVKFDADGGEAWRRQLGTAEDDFANAVAIDASGNVYLVGSTLGALTGTSVGNADAFLVKLDPGGAEQWRRQFGSTQIDSAQGVAIDPGGNVFVVGYTNGDLAGTAQNFDFFLVKFDAAGTELWRRQFGTVNADRGFGVSTDASGNAYTAGFSQLNNTAAEDALLVKWSPDGAELYRARLNSLGNGNEEGLGVACAPGGDAYLVGYTFDALVGTHVGGSGTDAFVAKIH